MTDKTMKKARYHVHHETHYRYAAPVSLSQQLLHLFPRDCNWQQCLSRELSIEPAPALQQEKCDVFGNPLTRLAFETQHRALSLTTTLDIQVEERTAPDLTESPAWEDVATLLTYHADRTLSSDALDACRFRYESPAVRLKKAFTEYGDDCFLPDVPLLVGSHALMEKIFRDFTFDERATEIATPLLEVLESKRGVCQDFAHLMIACLRSRGLAARYVSGYLLTTPPPGQARLIGADASHAWVSVYCPQQGWIDFDPTNNLLPSLEHITLAWGRDFTDVSPLRGVILGGGEHDLAVKVTVVPYDEATDTTSRTALMRNEA